MSYTAEQPIQYTPDPSKLGALAGGKVWFGVPNGNPASVPGDRIQVYLARQGLADLAIAQPIDIGPGGAWYYSGSPAQIKVLVPYCVQIINSLGAQKFYAPSAGDDIAKFNALDIEIAKSVKTVENFAALSSTSATIGQQVSVLGSQGGLFDVVSSSGLSADGGIIAINGAIAFVRNFDGPADIDFFGANADNQDITAILQAADNACYGKYKIVFNTKRSYLLSAQISFKCEIDFMECTIKQKAASNLENMFFTNTAGAEIHNGIIDINVGQQTYAAPKTDVGRGIFAYNTNSIKIYGTKFKNPYGSMILAAACSKVGVFGCDINDQNSTGTNAIVFNTCTDSYANSCTGIGKVGVTGYGIHAFGDCEYLRAEGNDFKYWQITFIGDDYITPATFSKMRYCRIDGNRLTEPSADTSIHFGFFGSVSNNLILNSRDVGISIDYSRYLAVNGNTILESNASGIGMPGCLYCSVNGNVLLNPGSQWYIPVDLGQRSGIWAPRSFSASPPYVYPHGNSFSGNTIADTKGVHTMYAGISIADDAGNNVNSIGRNFISGYLNYEYDVPKQTNIQGGLSIVRPTLLNSWVNYGSGYEPAGYYKNQDGQGFLIGHIKDGSIGSPSFVLPAEYRPVTRMIFMCINDTGSSRLDIFPNGDVVIITGSTGFVSLSGISFPIR